MSEIEINGMAHVILTVTRFREAREFYKITYEFCYDKFPQTKHLWKQKAHG